MAADKGIYIAEFGYSVEDDQEYCEAAAEIVDEYCSELQREEGMTREIGEDEWIPGYEGDGDDILYTDKASKLIEQEVGRWREIGMKYWPDGDIDIWQHLTQYKEL